MWKFLCLVSGLVCACGVSGGSESSFLAALPSGQTLEISAPDGGTAAQLEGSASVGTAQLYVLTRQTTEAVNGLVGGVLETLGAIAAMPPSAVSADSAAWGPFSDALSPVAWRVAVSQLGPGQHSFQLDIRPKNGTDADFQPFLQGASQGASPNGPSQGTFSVDLGVAQRLDPVGNPNVGQIVASWNVQTSGREVHVDLAGVQRPSGPSASADVSAVLYPDGSGALAFDANTSLVANGTALEVGRVGSRWIPTGAGRADAEVSQADGGWGVGLTECWDASFDDVYVRAETSTGDGGSEGNPSACVFANSLL
ncbi:MAG: hypothetical protein ACLQIH_15650 [Myxococcaceae bacterium]